MLQDDAAFRAANRTTTGFLTTMHAARQKTLPKLCALHSLLATTTRP
jgi:hypothetical protein